MNFNWDKLAREDVSTESLLTSLADSDEPVALHTLALTFVKEWLKYHPLPQDYDPLRAYTPDLSLRLPDGRVARIARVTQGYNPVQGHFQILTFIDPDLPRLVAGLGQQKSDSPSVLADSGLEAEIEDQARDILRGDAGPHLRRIVREALQTDTRTVGFADEWWLADRLPYQATQEDIDSLRDLLREQVGGEAAPSPVPPVDLAQVLWDVAPEDIQQIKLATFSLNCILDGCDDFCYQRVGGWMLTEYLPDLRVQRQPHVPRIRSRVLAYAGTPAEAEAQLEGEGELAQTLEEAAEPAPEEPEETAPDAWQDIDHWRQTLAWPEARVLLRGQHYIEGFLPLSKQGLRRVIPPGENEIELAWLIFRQPDNTEGRIQVAVDYRQGAVIGGSPLRDYLASQGILPGCYLYVHRRNDVEYDIYPKLLSQPVEVPCKFARIDEEGVLVTETEPVQVRYEHDPKYVVSEARLDDMEALWREALELGLSFFDILVMHVFPRLAPHGEAVHWQKLWEAIFRGYRMGTQQAIQHELRRLCFVPMGDGYYCFEPERGYGFPPRKDKLTRKRPGRPLRSQVPEASLPGMAPPEETQLVPVPIDSGVEEADTIQSGVADIVDIGGRGTEDQATEPASPALETPQPQPPSSLTWSDLATIETKYLFAGPSPLGRILNYIRRIKEGSYTTVLRGPRQPHNLDQWTVYAMVGLNLVQRMEDTGGTPRLTGAGEAICTRLSPFGDFSEAEDSATVGQIRDLLLRQDKELFQLLRDTFLASPSLQALLPYLRSLDLPLSLRELYTQFDGFCPEMTKVTAEHRLPGLLRVAEFCGVVDWDSAGRLTLAPESENVPEEKGEGLLEPVRAGLPAPMAVSAPVGGLPSADAHIPPPPVRPAGSKLSAKRDDMQSKTLFSSHYLEYRLPHHPEWAEDPQPILEAIRPLWQKAGRYGNTWNEAQTEDDFIKPVLNLLGWSYIVQAQSKKAGQVTRPDYVLFADAASRDAAYPYQGHDDAFYSRALAVGEAKYWGRPLSQKDQSGRDTWKAEGNPSHQMVSYLVGTRVSWGILTNGRVWRLYSREVSSTASEFYEVDLGLVFDFLPEGVEPTAEQLDQFRRWWLFFRRDAFVPDPQGKSFVQRIHEGSGAYAREISDKLKELVFEQVMPEITGGFIAYRYHQLSIREETEESLRQIYQASLGLLYKLLFVLYAEARGLLPMANPGYREGSLTAMASWAADWLDKDLPISDTTHATARYDMLLALFHRVDQGDPALGVPRYNGGLFNPAAPDNQFLAGHRLSDRAVARAVDILVRDAGQPVDYAYISVRNLGAIYEGLLENRLRVVDAARGRVELVNDKGERKASGSYYTPDYIVEYIVQHTLRPILDEREAGFRTAMDRCTDLRRKLAQAEDKTTNRLLQEQLEDAERDAREAFLGIKVLDPAIGSGHFLVNAVDYLTDGIIQRIQTYHDEHPDVPWAWNPIQKLVETVREGVLAEMERQGIAVDPDRLDDTALLTRLVMKRCIYGVDLNPMAVELAKLSLWLHSFTVGAPLSFLDHHLRWGNSLIGVDEVEKYILPGTERWNELLRGLANMVQVSEMTDATFGEVSESSRLYSEARQTLLPTVRRLNTELGAFFDESLKPIGQAAQLAYMDDQDTASAPLESQRKYFRAQQLAEEKGFFHWKLEFPEVFVDLRRRDWAENPGFDAVIGNPPYVRSIRLKEVDPEAWAYYTDIYRAAAKREYDIYLCFVEQGLELLNPQGHFGMILPNKWFTTQVGESLRSLLAQRQAVEHIVDFTHFQVFEQVTTYTCLLFLKGSPCDAANVAILEEAAENLHPLPGVEGDWRTDMVSSKVFDEEAWTLAMGPAGSLLEKLAELPCLEELATVFMGTGTRADQVFLMKRRGDRFYSRSLERWVEIEEDLMHPSLTGRDIDPYYYETDNYLLFPYRFIDEEAHLISSTAIKTEYPKAWAYLNHPANRKLLQERDRGKFRTRADWYCHSYPRNMNLLGMTKLVLPDVAGKAEFAYDFEGLLTAR